MAAYQQAVQRTAAVPAPIVAASSLMRAPLSRVEAAVSGAPAPAPDASVDAEQQQADSPASQPAASSTMGPAPRDSAPAAEPPDLDAITDHVLERLRHELRDGRERLGFRLDDMR
jgi:hypothetical protein